MSKKSTVFNIVIPAQMMEQINSVVDEANSVSYQSISKSQFVRDCIEHVLKHLDKNYTEKS